MTEQLYNAKKANRKIQQHKVKQVLRHGRHLMLLTAVVISY